MTVNMDAIDLRAVIRRDDRICDFLRAFTNPVSLLVTIRSSNSYPRHPLIMTDRDTGRAKHLGVLTLSAPVSERPHERRSGPAIE